MIRKKVTDSVSWLGFVDWDRRLFDALIPLPDGTSYNAYLVEGARARALIDSADPVMRGQLLEAIADVPAIDYLVSNHAEQDHSGLLPELLERYPGARLVCSQKAAGMLQDLLHVPAARLEVVADGASIDLGGKTLEFIYTPWVHWPETMSTFLREEGVLFSCDLFGAHIASSELFVRDRARVEEAAKRYFAEIMMPFRQVITKNLERLASLEIKLIAPSHGQLYDEPGFIIDAYRRWVAGPAANRTVVAFVSMHGSTWHMAERLVAALARRGVEVERYELTSTDLGKLAISLVDAAGVLLGTPTVLAGPHPAAVQAAFLANALRPRLHYLGIFGSYGWGGRTVEMLGQLLGNVKAEILEPVLCKGLPRAEDYERLEALAEAVASRHRKLELLPG